ncbi:UNVERIFIED_CONTAM: putative receptor-like protein kinase [Sesamum calycinum]|uniref:non-specific serine/threonine protein kinase n=1 Tax=Sesamum calycinum TaxID=2727403 RepID=A0AAW2K6B5_9LAMI
MSSESLNAELSKKYGALKLWVLIGICVGRQSWGPKHHDHLESYYLTVNDKSSDKNSEKFVHLGRSKSSDADNISQCSSMYHHERAGSSQSGEEGSSGNARRHTSLSYGIAMPSPLIGLPEISHLGWGHWFTLRDLEIATNRFSAEHVIGEGGYGVVYRGRLVNGTEVAVKKLLNNLGQAEKEFRVEVEAIGHVRHKNLVRLLGYCIEGVHRMLVYEYVNNGNLEQWLHGAMRQHGTLTWEARMKVLLGTAKAYVAPEYANTGLLNEKSDIYSFGVLLLEAVTGRDPVDYGQSGRSRDPNLEVKPTTVRALKRALLVALRCVDPDSEKRPKMSHVVRMLETDDYPYREDRRSRKSRTTSMDIESTKDGSGSAEMESRIERSGSQKSETTDRN